MARKSRGFVKLEWTCPNCDTRNPGPQKSCSSCGSPQPENVVFQKADQDQLITKQSEIDQARKGVDIHCPYCGTRNAAGIEICAQCGGDLTEGQARDSGLILGAFQDKQKTLDCPNCGTENPSTITHCANCGASIHAAQVQPPKVKENITQQTSPKRKLNPILLLLPVIVIIALCIVLVILFTRKTDLIGEVDSMRWYREIAIEEFGQVNHQAWINVIPSEAEILSCTLQYQYTSEEPAHSATEVCGTPYVVDDGSGYGEVIEDCVYEVYTDWCNYSINEWYITETISSEGYDQEPFWPEFTLAKNQRFGDNSESFTVNFLSEEGRYIYTTTNFDIYAQFNVGSRWILTINALNAITDIEPLN